MAKQDIASRISDYLLRQEEIVFAYLFGSFIYGDVFRDIDVAVYMEVKPDLIRFGLIKAELDQLTGHETDLVLLNGLSEKNPAFANEIISRGELLFSRDSDLYTAYRRKALLHYMDTARLREQIEQALERRIETNKFGLRDYA